MQFHKYQLIPEDPSEFKFTDEAYVPDADAIKKTLILVKDPDLAQELGIPMEERQGAFLERESENER
jgi:hypothetical protein